MSAISKLDQTVGTIVSTGVGRRRGRCEEKYGDHGRAAREEPNGMGDPPSVTGKTATNEGITMAKERGY